MRRHAAGRRCALVDEAEAKEARSGEEVRARRRG
jgi:hypothetical protein